MHRAYSKFDPFMKGLDSIVGIKKKCGSNAYEFIDILKK